VDCYERIGNPHLAAEVVALLESDPEQKRSHPALYLRAKESVRRDREFQARAKRVGSFVRSVLNVVVMGPISFVVKLMRDGGHMAVECLPKVPGHALSEAATARVTQLQKAFPQKSDEFKTQDLGVATEQHAVADAKEPSAAKVV